MSSRNEAGYPDSKTVELLEALDRLQLTERDYAELASACASRTGASAGRLELIDELLGLVP